MATLKAFALYSCHNSSPSFNKNGRSILSMSNLERGDHHNVSVSRLLADEWNRRNCGLRSKTSADDIGMLRKQIIRNDHARKGTEQEIPNLKEVQELHAIMGIVADRVEMHKNIGIQRDNWNHLLLNSVNGMTVTAATMAGLSASSEVGAPILALKLSSTVLYIAATAILLVMNKIQPSQLAEEKRNAARLFKQLHEDIKVTLALGNPSPDDVKEAMEKVLALDKAYPLPLIGNMLDKFPKTVEPAVWWPQHMISSQHEDVSAEVERNGWNEQLEEEMKEIIGVLKRKDIAEYLRLGKVALKISKILSISGPLFTGLAAFGSAFVGMPHFGSLPSIFGVTFGAFATIVNTLEHGGQVGMVFEMYRSCAGWFTLIEDTLESTLNEREVDKREDGDVLEVKVALQLGRSLSELRDLGNTSTLASRLRKKANKEFASKLF